MNYGRVKEMLLTTKNRLLKHSYTAAAAVLYKLLRSRIRRRDRLFLIFNVLNLHAVNVEHPAPLVKCHFHWIFSVILHFWQQEVNLKSCCCALPDDFVTLLQRSQSVWLVCMDAAACLRLSSKGLTSLINGLSCLLSTVFWLKSRLEDTAVICLITLSFPKTNS